MVIFLIISGLIILGMFANGDYLIAFVSLLTIGGSVTAFLVMVEFVGQEVPRERKTRRGTTTPTRNAGGSSFSNF